MMNLPLEERPRERLIADGEMALSNAELIAIVLGSGMRGKSVITLAQELLSRFGSLETLMQSTFVELSAHPGMGRAKAVQLKAVGELAKRLSRQKRVDDLIVSNSEVAFHSLRDLFMGEGREIIACLMLDAKMKIIHREVVSVGTLSEVLVHPREIFYPAVRYKAHSIIIAHNHPSGDLTPSKKDITLTKQLQEAGILLQIPLIDHLILARNTYFSLSDERLC